MIDSETHSGQRPYAVVDIDGVVADVRHRLHHVETRPKNWRAFFAAASDDDLLAEGAALVHELSELCDIVWLTGRPTSLRGTTAAWLQRHELPPGTLLMRRSRDFRPSAVFKLERLVELARRRPLHTLVDDDLSVLTAAEKAGFAVVHADWMARPAALVRAQEQDGRT